MLDILSNLAEVLAIFETGETVHGDVSMRNVLWSADPARGCYVLDCDAVQLRGCGVGVPVVGTPEWTDPRFEGRAYKPDIDSDRWALGAAFYRCYYQRRGSKLANVTAGSLPTSPPTSPRLAKMLEQSLNLAGRPTAREWKREIDRVMGRPRTGEVPRFVPRSQTTSTGKPSTSTGATPSGSRISGPPPYRKGKHVPPPVAGSSSRATPPPPPPVVPSPVSSSRNRFRGKNLVPKTIVAVIVALALAVGVWAALSSSPSHELVVLTIA